MRYVPRDMRYSGHRLEPTDKPLYEYDWGIVTKELYVILSDGSRLGYVGHGFAGTTKSEEVLLDLIKDARAAFAHRRHLLSIIA